MTRSGHDGSPPALDILDDIYALYDAFSNGLAVACRRGCCVCCTQAVTITTLEGRRIRRAILGITDKLKREDLIRAIRDHVPTSPSPVTTNGVVRLCLEDRDLPGDPRPPGSDPCLFLSSGECLIYPDRPFGCRAFFSTQRCHRGGSAVIDPYWLTVNGIFLQFIEDLDVDGAFGPINRVLSFLLQGRPSGLSLSSPDSRDVHPTGLARNIPIPALMIPPEHEDQLQPLLRELQAIRHGREMTNQPPPA